MNESDPSPKQSHETRTLPLDPQATQALGREPAGIGGPKFPIENWERFQVLAFLGEGGMGRVYKAKDPRLNRLVALKFIRGDDPELLRRFEAEAKSQALIEHPHVCKVYEVGSEQDQHYIAMQFIDGMDLKKARSTMSLEEKIRVMVEVTEAIHAAHRQGIVHRDIKPANIMLERGEQGRWWPFVMDFGLARDAAGPGLTLTGMAMGTPAYMPPEQALGRLHEIDRRSDVYSLGATLYELLADVPPFEAESAMDILLKVIKEDPLPLRKRFPSIPIDLETIVQKCLEKEPRRRYDSAKALAEDLGRYLDGDPVQARPASLVYRVQKRLQKNRTLTAAVLLSSLLGLGFTGYGLRATVQAHRQTQLANRFALEVKSIEDVMRIAHMRPLHDLRSEKSKVRTKIESLRRELISLGSIAEGPGNHALGLGYLSLGEFSEARQALQKAWDRDYRPPQVALALGQVLGALYEESARTAQQLPKESREAQLAELKKALLEPAKELIRQHLDAREEGRVYLEALLAHLQEREEDAIARSRDAIQENPGLYQAKGLEARAYLALAQVKRNTGDSDGCHRDLEAAGEALKEALGLGRSDGSLWRIEADRRLALSALSAERSPMAVVEAGYRSSVEACQKALNIDPEDASAMLQAAMAWHELATLQLDHGVDNRPALEEAQNSAERAIAQRPKDGELHFWLGRVDYALARQRDHQGLDPREAYNKALEAYGKAQKLGRESSERAGLTLLFKALYERRQGLDPSPSLDEALRLVRHARAFREDRFSLNTTGLVLNVAADWAMVQGKDPRALLQEAENSFQTGFDHYHAFASLRNLADSLVLEARYERAQSRDPEPVLARALDAIHRAIAMGPNYFLSHLTEGEIRLLQIRQALEHKQEPSFTEGRAALEKAIRLNPQDPDAYLRSAQLELLTSGEGRYSRALKRLEQALKLAPSSADVYAGLAELQLKRAEASSGTARRTAVSQGLRSTGQALTISPRHPEALALKRALEDLKE